VVAPYWSDNDIRREGNVSYEVFQLQATGAYGDQLLDDVSSYIRERNTSSQFRGSFMILAEWDDVHPYPHGASNVSDDDPFLAKVQCIYALYYAKEIIPTVHIVLLNSYNHVTFIVDQHLPGSCDY